MNLTSSEALVMIKECEKVVEDKHWISHSINVGNSARFGRIQTVLWKVV